jgi:hypothetical protein
LQHRDQNISQSAPQASRAVRSTGDIRASFDGPRADLGTSKTAVLWPEDTFQSVPPPEEAIRLAEEIRASFDGLRADLDACCQAAAVEFAEAPLRSSEGGCQAMLIPRKAGGFRVVVDAALTPASAGESVVRHRRRFRIAHELGHTFFYWRQHGRPRRAPATPSPKEEEFCDVFARALLAPSPAKRLSASEVVLLQTTCDVSLEVAARAVAAGPRGQRVGLWWWPGPAFADGRVAEQWLSDSELPDAIGVPALGITPEALPQLLAAAKSALSDRLSARLLPDRCQLLTILD